MNQYLAIAAPYIIAVLVALTTATFLTTLDISSAMVGAIGAGTGVTVTTLYKKYIPRQPASPSTQ